MSSSASTRGPVLTPHRVRSIRGALSLLGSGVVGACGMLILSRGWFPGITASHAALIVVFIQWELLVLTCARWGLDQLVFAQLGTQPSVRPALAHHLLTRATPIALLAMIFLAPAFGVLSSALLGITAICDTAATIGIAALAAHRRYREVSIANIINYPAFFALLCVLGLLSSVTLPLVAMCYLVSSVLRLLWVTHVLTTDSVRRTAVRLEASFILGSQQALNVLVFRGDQLLIPFVAAQLFTNDPGSATLAAYVFLARYPELFSSVLVTVAPVILPTLDRRVDAARARGQFPLMLLGIAGVMFVAGIGVALGFVWLGPAGGSFLLALPFAAAASLALPANLATYSLMRRDRLKELLAALGIGITAGALIAGAGVFLASPAIFAWSSAVALGTMMAFALLRPLEAPPSPPRAEEAAYGA